MAQAKLSPERKSMIGAAGCGGLVCLVHQGWFASSTSSVLCAAVDIR
jgi:hypothetical protein